MSDWTVPPMARTHEPVTAGERATLDGLLDWHRATLVWKCAGLTGAQLAQRPVPASSLSLLGLIRHLTDTERACFRGTLSVRWVYGHMIAEYARHLGHADLLREIHRRGGRRVGAASNRARGPGRAAILSAGGRWRLV